MRLSWELDVCRGCHWVLYMLYHSFIMFVSLKSWFESSVLQVLIAGRMLQC